MNHAGEITPLTQMVRPHVAVITTVEPVHLEYFASVEAIAEAKAEILQGLVPGGTAVLPRDNPHFPLLRSAPPPSAPSIVTFGYHDEAGFALPAGRPRTPRAPPSSPASARSASPTASARRASTTCRNSLAVLAALVALGADAMRRLPALARVAAPAGRGRAHAARCARTGRSC